MDGQKTVRMLEDARIPTKLKLSALWAALMFFYIYPDILGFMEPGHIEAFAAGHIEGVRITPALLYGSAILMAVPSVMVFVALALSAKVGWPLGCSTSSFWASRPSSARSLACTRSIWPSSSC